MRDESSNRPLRLFVAIPVPERVRNAIAAVQRELQALAPRGAVRWTRPEQIHLTFVFLGDVAADRVGDLTASVQKVSAGQPELSLSAAGIGFFPNARSPRVIWAGVGDEMGRLADLQKQIARAVAPFSAEPDKENFVGHLTLGRVKDSRNSGVRELVNRTQTMGNRRFGEWPAREVEIIRSELTPDGARHSPVAIFPLGANLECETF